MGRMAEMSGHDGDPNAAFDRSIRTRCSISRDEFAKARDQRIESVLKILKNVRNAPRTARMLRSSLAMHRGLGGDRMIVRPPPTRTQITLAEPRRGLQHFDQMTPT